MKVIMVKITVLISCWLSALALAQNVPNWSVTPSSYEHFMTVTGKIVLNGTVPADSSYWIGAFAGSQCRGVTRPTLTNGQWLVFLLTYGNVQNEKLNFTLFNAKNGQTYPVTEELLFQISASVGQPTTPFVFHASPPAAVGTEITPASIQLGQNYPNPFNPTTTIRYSLPSPHRVVVKIYTTLGEEVEELVNAEQSAGWYEIVWNAKTSSGIYYYRMNAVSVTGPNKQLSQLRKMILLK